MIVAGISVGKSERICGLAFRGSGIDLPGGNSRVGDAPVGLATGILGVEPLPAGISAAGIVGILVLNRCGGSTEEELMRGKARPLVGLKHVIGPAVLVGKLEVRVQNAGGAGRVDQAVLGEGHGCAILADGLVGA